MKIRPHLDGGPMKIRPHLDGGPMRSRPPFHSRARVLTGVLLALSMGSFGCDEDPWQPSDLATTSDSPIPVEPSPAVRGAAPTGSARMPNLPAQPTPEQEAQIARLIQESGGGGSGGGGQMPEILQPYDRFGENAEGLSEAQAASLLGDVLGAGRNVLGQEVTPCDRVLAMAGVAANATGDRPVDPEEVRRLCGQIPPEVLACVQPEAEQSPADQRRCRNLFGQASLIERVDPDERNPLPRARTEADVRRLLGLSQEERPRPTGPREEPMVVQ